MSLTLNPEQNWNFFEYDPTEYDYSRQGWPKMMQLPYEYPNKKVFVINEDDYWSGVIKDTYIKEVNKSGWEIVGNETSAVGAVEWGAILTKIRAADPAIVMMIALTPTSEAAFLNQFQKDPTNSLVHMPFLPVTPEVKQLAGKNANGVIWNTILAMLPSPEGDVFKKRFVKKFGAQHWRRDFPPAIWDMMHHWENAVKAVGKVDDYRAIANYVEKTPYKGLCGTYVFPKETHTSISSDEYLPASFYQIQNGEDVLLSPEKYRQGQFIVPWWIKK
jgi:branched-chain amino acid transport system substrate-binding protein